MLCEGVLPKTVPCLFLLFYVSLCDPPPDPIKCSSPNNTNCTITNSYGAFPDRTVCRAADVVYPSTEEELVSAIAAATKAKRKMKVATRFSHSITKLVCPDKSGGGGALLVSTKYLNHTLDIDLEAMTMTVESGVTLQQLINEAAREGLALPYAPYWWGLTIGGMMGTGAHGSSLWGNGSSVHDHVVKVRIVSPGRAQDGYVKVRTLDGTQPDLNAVKVSLGVLGVISQVTLKLQPMFKRSITYKRKSDETLADEASSFGSEQEFGDITWYPSQRRAVYRFDHRVSPDVSGNGLYDFIGFRSTLSVEMAIVRTAEENHEATKDANGKCIDSKITTGTLAAAAYGLTNNGVIFTGYPVVGDQNRLQASGTCLNGKGNGRITACPWDPKLKKRQFFHQTTFSIALSKVKPFVQDVQQLLELEPKALCGVELYNGILMRYVKASTAYLGKQDDALDFDITYYRSYDPMTPRLYEDILEEIEQMGVFKYNGLPHWGKNRNLAFQGAINNYKNAEAFLKVKNAYDPLGLFSSEWTDQVLGLRNGGVSIDGEGCALEGLCICSEDIHCAPKKGYFCRPGRIYNEARVCTSNTNTKGILTKGEGV